MELVLSLVVIGLASRYLVHFMHSMATTSLWNDELYSATRFSGSGRSHADLLWRGEQPHLLQPAQLDHSGCRSIEPLRARLWSFAAVGATAGLLLWEFFRRRWFPPAPCSSSCSPRTTGGSTSRCRLAGTGSSAGAPSRLASRSRATSRSLRTKWLIALALATLIGTWTIPTYIIWAGPLWLLLLLTVREAGEVLRLRRRRMQSNRRRLPTGRE